MTFRGLIDHHGGPYLPWRGGGMDGTKPGYGLNFGRWER